MPFHVTSDQDLVRKTVRELVEEVKGETAEHVDRERAFPLEPLRKLAAMGLTGMLVPPEKGGPGTDTVSFVLAIEEVARASGTLALVLNNLNAFGTFPLARAGTEEACAAALAPALAGEAYVAWGLTEPNAGADSAALQTRARRDGSTYVLDGLKSFVVGAPQAKFFLVFAAMKGVEGTSAFLVPANAEGLLVAPVERTMTMRGSDMAQVFLKGVRVPEAYRLGAEGEGTPLAKEATDLAALGGAAIAVGLMQASHEESIQYAGEREQFRTPLKRFQAMQFLVAEMEVRLRASRLMTLAAADKRDRGEAWRTDAAMAKLFAAESSHWLTRKGIRLHGGTGFMRDLPLERYNRDARSTSIYAGTAEMERARIAAEALGL